MVQALAFAELFAGLILAYTGYKGTTVTETMKGETAEKAPAALGSAGSAGAAGGTGATGAVNNAASIPAGPGVTADNPGGLTLRGPFLSSSQEAALQKKLPNHPSAFTGQTGAGEG
jgi:hypothetical protein